MRALDKTTWSEAKDLQRPLSDSLLQIVARGVKRDKSANAAFGVELFPAVKPPAQGDSVPAGALIVAHCWKPAAICSSARRALV
jgi:hypothetical protein